MLMLFAVDDSKNLVQIRDWERISMGANNGIGYGDWIRIIPSYHPRLGTKVSVPDEWIFRLDSGATSRQIGHLYGCQYSFSSSNAITQVEQDYLVLSGASSKVLALFNGTYDATVLRNLYMKYALTLTGNISDLTFANMNAYLEIYVYRG